MKFPRNAKLLRSPFDVAPFAAVFFLLVIFLILGALLPAPGLFLSLPSADDSSLAGTDQPTVVVAIDASGRLFYANQIVSEDILSRNLHQAAAASRQPLTLVIQADKKVEYDKIIHISLLARDAGIFSELLATQPRIVTAPTQP
jgi:biopolymer transport protein ExbD